MTINGHVLTTMSVHSSLYLHVVAHDLCISLIVSNKLTNPWESGTKATFEFVSLLAGKYKTYYNSYSSLQKEKKGEYIIYDMTKGKVVIVKGWV